MQKHALAAFLGLLATGGMVPLPAWAGSSSGCEQLMDDTRRVTVTICPQKTPPAELSHWGRINHVTGWTGQPRFWLVRTERKIVHR